MKKILAMLVLSIFMVGGFTGIVDAAEYLNSPASEQALKTEESVKELRVKHKESIYALKEIKPRLLKCKDLKTADCLKVKEDVKILLKEHLLRNMKVLYNHLENLKERYEGSDVIVDKIEEYQLEIREHYGDVKDADNDQLKLSLKKYRTWLSGIKYTVKGFYSKLNMDRVDTFLKRADDLESKFRSIIVNLREEGRNIDELEASINSFSTYLDNARENYRKAKSLGTEGEYSQEAIELMDDARDYLKSARKDMNKIVKKFGEHGWSVYKIKQQISPQKSSPISAVGKQ